MTKKETPKSPQEPLSGRLKEARREHLKIQDESAVEQSELGIARKNCLQAALSERGRGVKELKAMADKQKIPHKSAKLYALGVVSKEHEKARIIADTQREESMIEIRATCKEAYDGINWRLQQDLKPLAEKHKAEDLETEAGYKEEMEKSKAKERKKLAVINAKIDKLKAALKKLDEKKEKAA